MESKPKVRTSHEKAEFSEGELVKEEWTEESPLLSVGSSLINGSPFIEASDLSTTSPTEQTEQTAHLDLPHLSCSHGVRDIEIASHLKTPRLVNRQKKKAIFVSSNEGIYPYILNLYHTSVSLSWGVIASIFVLLYTLSFAFWGLVYWVIDTRKEMMCIENIESYLGAFFFAVQTQMTIGYGNMYPEDRCFFVVISVTLHSLFGILLDALVLGVVYARFSRPQLRSETILLSEKAVVTTSENGERHFVFRLANLRRSQLIETHLRLILHRCLSKTDGEAMIDFRDLELEEAERPFLALPVLISHRLDENSVIQGLSPDFLRFTDPELIVMVEGIDATTSDSVQVLFSYKTEDIVFDHHFTQMINMEVDEKGALSYFVDFEKFNSVSPDLPQSPH